MSCELVDFIMQSVIDGMREQQFSEVQIEKVQALVSPSVAEKTLTTFGGNKIYIPKRMHNKESLSEILAKQFTGNNINEVAKANKVSRRTVYSAIQSQRIKKLNSR